jgi:hypothetical protein
MKLDKIETSKAKGKRLVAIFSNPNKTVNFGSLGANTYIDGASKITRENYIKRHRVNENWTKPDNAGSLSRFILWGDSTNIKSNIDAFKKKFSV